MCRMTAGIAVLCFAGMQGAIAEETFINTRSFTAEGDVAVKSAVDAIKKTPQDAVDMVGDAVKFVVEDTALSVKNIADAIKADPEARTVKEAMREVDAGWTDPMKEIVFRSYRVSESVGLELAPDVASGVADVSGYFSQIDFPKGTSAYYRPDFQRLFVRHTLESMLDIEDVIADLHNATRNLMGHQIEIETKFVEVNQKTLDELGFNWTFRGKNDGPLRLLDNNLTLPAGSDIFTQALRTGAVALGTGSPEAATLSITRDASAFRWDLVINALEQADDTNVLSAPRIVTRDGCTASIHVGEEEMFPRSFQVRTVSTSLFVEHRDWENQIMGVTLDVTPELREGGLIDLELAPKVIDLIGYTNYKASPDAVMRATQLPSMPLVTRTIDGAASPLLRLYSRTLGSAARALGGANTTGVDPNLQYDYEGTEEYLYNRYNEPGLPIGQHSGRIDDQNVRGVPATIGQMPYFRLREMNSRVTVADGSTVGMGGLIYDKLETFRDRVPVLGSIPLVGRLFRSEGQRNIKRNLMVFVTASQVDVHGRRAGDVVLAK